MTTSTAPPSTGPTGPTGYEILDRTITMPVQVADASAGTVIFEVDLTAARALAPRGFEVVESAPGKAQAALALVDYRVNDLGAYLEVGTILFVRPEGGATDGSQDGTFITHLPVDQEFTCVAGNQIWGYPKSVEHIEVTQTDTTSRWVLTMAGQLVLDVTVPRGGTDEMPPLPMTSYTLKDGVPHATTFTQGGAGSSIGFGEGVSLTLGDHPIADELRSLGLPDAPVAVTTWTERMQATFDDAVPLA